MGFIPVQPQKTREMRERYRKARRVQQVKFTLLGCAVLLVFAFVWWLVALLHRPAGAGAAGGRLSAARPAGRSSEPPLRVVGEKQFSSAPWQFEVDSQGFYYFSDTQRNSGTRPNYLCNQMGAEPAKGGKPRWELPGDFALQHSSEQSVDWADGTLVGLTQRLTDKQLDLTGWDAASGAQRWTSSIEKSSSGIVRAHGPMVIVTCRLSDGYRMIGYSSASGAKLWGVKLPLKGLAHEFAAAPGGPTLRRLDNSYASVYTCGDIIGVVDPVKGKLLNEYRATGVIQDTVIVDHSQTAYILVKGNQPTSFSIVSVPLKGLSPHPVLSLQNADGAVFFLVSQSWLLTCCREPQAAGSVLRVRCQPLDSGAAQYMHDIPGGHAVCGAPLGGDDPGFLVGVSTDGAAAPAGDIEAQSFVVVDPVRGEVADAGKTAQPVLSIAQLTPNQQGRLLGVGDAGMLYRFDSSKQRFVNLHKLKYPVITLRQSDDRTTLLVTSTTEQYANATQGGLLSAEDGLSKSGQQAPPIPLQALVIQ